MTDVHSDFDAHRTAQGQTSDSSWPAPSLVQGSFSSVDDARPALHPLMSPEQNVQRIMSTGTVWFAAAVGAVAIFSGLLLASGWRPAALSTGVRVLWWVGTGIVTLSIGLIGWSGCPILEVDVPTADHNKTRTMQFGTAMFIIGGFLSLLAVFMGPAS